MMRSTVIRGSIMAAMGAALMLGATLASAEDDQPTLKGTWRVMRHGVDCVTGDVHGSFPAIMTFNAGGTYTGFGAPPGSTPADGSPEYGVWQREPGAHTFSFRFFSLGYEGATYVGTGEITGKAKVSAQGDSLSYSATITFFDVNGNPLGTICGRADGTRFE